MDKNQLNELYEKNVQWLRKNIPPDDIYDYSEQTFMAALYFMKKYSESIHFQNELDSNPITRKWARNLSLILYLREHNINSPIDLQLEFLDEEDAKDN